MFGDTITSFIRTYVPVIIGAGIAWLVQQGIDIDGEALKAAGVAIAIALYYALARVLEKRWPVFGWLLGTPKQPTYQLPS
jgi:hypothetical protein